jgi:hypothetical protein
MVNTTHHSLSINAAKLDAAALWSKMQNAAQALGFSQIGVTGVNLSAAEPGLKAWLAAGFHGSMNYMASHGLKRARPAELVPGTVSVITVRMDYLPNNVPDLSVESEANALKQPMQGLFMPEVGTTTRFCASGCKNFNCKWLNGWALLATESLQTLHLLWKPNWQSEVGRAGEVNTPWCCSEKQGHFSFWVKFSLTLSYPKRKPRHPIAAPVRHALMFAQREPLWRRINWMRAVVFLT